MVTDRRDKSGHEKVFPIPGVNTRGYCSHLKPSPPSLSLFLNEKERGASSENQGEERGSVEEGEEVTKTKDRGLARGEGERKRERALVSHPIKLPAHPSSPGPTLVK